MSLTLEIITPDKKVLSTEAEQVVLPTESGEIGVLTGHVPMITKLIPGELKVIQDGNADFVAVSSGFAKIIGNTISVLTEAAIDVQEIDESELTAAQERAQEALVQAEAEGIDPEQLDAMERNVRYLVAQKLAKGRKR